MRQRLADGKRSIISYSGSCRHLIDMDRHNVRLYLTYSFLQKSCAEFYFTVSGGAVETDAASESGSPSVLQLHLQSA
jgi:hypothetical protein